MRTIFYQDILEKVAESCIQANTELDQDIVRSYSKYAKEESSDIAAGILKDLEENAVIAKKEHLPICQDTGTAVVFLELGQEVKIEGGYLYDAIHKGVAKGYEKGYLRKSIVLDPIKRVNTGTNTPAIIHLDIVPGEVFRCTVAPKGGGSENMSRLAMLTPSDGLEGFIKFVIETVRLAGPNPCPPVVVGACLGGNFETCALEAKKQLLRPLGEPHPDPEIAKTEKYLLKKINQLGVGPQGFGGKTTAFAVHLSFQPCHIASMPAAVNLNCHVARHCSFTL